MRKLKFSKDDAIIDVPCEPGTEPGAIAAMTAQGFTLMAEESDPASASQDLKRSKAEFFRSAGRLLLVLATATAPAAGVWFQQNAEMSKANAKAKVSLKVAASEKASNDKAWEAVVAKFAVFEDALKKQTETQRAYKEALIRFEERISILGRRHGVTPPPKMELKVHDPNGELDKARLGKKRPEPEPDGIIEAQRQIQLQFQDEP
jgi:hypothetical protein